MYHPQPPFPQYSSPLLNHDVLPVPVVRSPQVDDHFSFSGLSSSYPLLPNYYRFPPSVPPSFGYPPPSSQPNFHRRRPVSSLLRPVNPPSFRSASVDRQWMISMLRRLQQILAYRAHVTSNILHKYHISFILLRDVIVNTTLFFLVLASLTNLCYTPSCPLRQFIPSTRLQRLLPYIDPPVHPSYAHVFDDDSWFSWDSLSSSLSPVPSSNFPNIDCQLLETPSPPAPQDVSLDSTDEE